MVLKLAIVMRTHHRRVCREKRASRLISITGQASSGRPERISSECRLTHARVVDMLIKVAVVLGCLCGALYPLDGSEEDRVGLSRRRGTISSSTCPAGPARPLDVTREMQTLRGRRNHIDGIRARIALDHVRATTSALLLLTYCRTNRPHGRWPRRERRLRPCPDLLLPACYR